MNPRILCLALVPLVVFLVAADEEKKDDPLLKQRASAQSRWAKLEQDGPAIIETDRLIVVSNLPKEQLAKVVPNLDRMHDYAAKAMKFSSADPPWQGKLTVFILKDRLSFTSFVRRVEGRSPDPEEAGTADVSGPEPYIAVGPPRGGSISPGVQAGYQVCVALLKRRAGSAARIPTWLAEGFGRATAYRVSAFSASNRTGNAAWGRLLLRKPLGDLWKLDLSGDEITAYGAQLADFFAYGPGAAKGDAFFGGLKPGDRDRNVSVLAAIEAAGYEAEDFERAWRRYNGGR